MTLPSPRVAAIIASTGRTQVLRETVVSVLAQTWRPERLVLAVIKEADCDIRPGEFAGVEVILARKGLSAQLNDAVALLAPEIDYVCFFDDDVILTADYIERMVGFLMIEPGIVALSGLAFRDGDVTGDEARSLAANPPVVPVAFRDTGKHWVLYGCNMVIRRAPLEKEKFDERFVLYAWMFEIEMSYRLLPYGRVGRYSAGKLVHLKVQAGRISGLRFGYSEVVNRLYLALRPALAARRLYILSWALYYGVRSPLFNALYAITRRSDPYVDYAGRLRGNLRAWRDVACGRIAPERILELK